MGSLSLAILLLFTLSGFARELPELKDDGLKSTLTKAMSVGHKRLSYKEARVKLFNEIYLEKDEKGFYNVCVYCQTKFYRKAEDRLPSDILPDANVFNTEHTWPQSKFNPEMDSETQKTDLHHLFPTNNRINSERGNHPFADVHVGTPKKVSCRASKLGAPHTVTGTYFEPAKEHKGNVARALFYFSVRYNMPIDAVQEIFLKVWHLADPVDEKEKERHEIIAGIQKNRNPFIDEPGLVLKISDF